VSAAMDGERVADGVVRGVSSR